MLFCCIGYHKISALERDGDAALEKDVDAALEKGRCCIKNCHCFNGSAVV